MKNNKKFLFLVLALTPIAASIYIYSRLKGSSTLGNKSVLPESYYGKVLLESELTADNFATVPSQMSVFTASAQAFTQAYVENIAQSLNFTTPPTVLDNPQGGQVVNWYQESATFKAILPSGPFDYKVREFSYANVSPITNSNRDALAQLALDFFTSHHFINSDQIQLDTAQVGPYAAERETGSVDVNIYLVKFRQNIDNLPVVNLTEGAGTFSVNIDSEQHVVRAFVDKVQNYTPKQKADTISFSQYQKVFTQAKVEFIQGHDVNSQTLTKIIINEVKPGLLKQVTGDQILLKPILILSGQAIFSDTSSAVATLYLPAARSDY